MGTISNTTAACLDYSLDYILRLGVERIHMHRQPLLQRLQTELPRLGFQSMTPAESTSPIVTFAKQDTSEISARFKRAQIDVAIHPHRIRISPSVYNDRADVEKLLAALS